MAKELAYLFMTVALYATACLFVKFLSPQLIKSAYPKGYSPSLEVLRGIAAFLVFGAHSTMYFGMAPKQVIAGAMGQIGVFLFFMLTGHLFWGQIQDGRFDANTFFRKRIFRLVPAMLVIVAILSLLDWVTAGFPIPSATQLLLLFRNFGFGFGEVTVPFVPGAAVNDVFNENMYLRLNTIWTLRWEWTFYLCLPLIASFEKFSRVTVFTVALILFLMDPFQIIAGGTNAVFLIAFWLGGFSAYIEKIWKHKALYLPISTAIGIIGVFLLLTYLLYPPLTPNNIRVPVLVFLLFPIFFCFVAQKSKQNKFFTPSMQVIGKISYSFYLLHLSVLFYIIKIYTNTGINFQHFSTFFILYLIATIVCVVFSLISYTFVEEYFLDKSKKALTHNKKIETASVAEKP